MSSPVCTYDSGSMTGCVPLCDAPAVQLVTYGHGAYRVSVPRCARHVRPTENRAYPYACDVSDIAHA